MINVDVLAIFAHPDDMELTVGGTLLKMKSLGYKTGALDMTRGEMGTRGSAEGRAIEAADDVSEDGSVLFDRVGFVSRHDTSPPQISQANRSVWQTQRRTRPSALPPHPRTAAAAPRACAGTRA